MKKTIVMLLVFALLFSLAACGQEPEKETPEEGGPIDMEAFLQELAETNPQADTAALCEAMLENPYFRRFTTLNVGPFYPGFEYDYPPEGIREAAAIVDFTTGSGALVYAFLPEEGVDPEALSQELQAHADPAWLARNGESVPMPDRVTALASNGKVFLAVYCGDMMPIYGPIAENAQELVGIFHDYAAGHPEASCLEIAQHMNDRQKFVSMYTFDVEAGELEGFKAPIEGFSEGAKLSPVMMPTLFIGYVFRLPGDMTAFENTLRANADLAWNVCMVGDTVTIEKEGDFLLFMMSGTYQ